MFTELARRLSGISRRSAIVAALIAIAAVGGLAFLLTRSGSRVDADDHLEPRAARIERVEGDVQITRAEEEDWASATLNDPVEAGDRIFARDNSNCSIALTGHNYVRLNPATSLDVLTLSDQRTQLALRGGSAFFDVGALESDELYEVATPYGAVDFNEPGLYQIGMEDGNVIVSVLSGLAQVFGQGGSDEISAGEVITLAASAAAPAIASRLAPRLGGEIVDDYYRSRYPTSYDGRYEDYDAYLSDPFYYDPYRSSASYRYVPADIPGIYDLDSYGDWTNVSGYGNCWAPRVGSGWAPFREGSWNVDGLWGPTWVSTEPWGWAPYHYGRWTFVEQRWFWVPTEVVRRPAYYAAPVAFIPLAQTAQIAWVPLAPGEPFVQRYYDRNFQPRYLASNQMIREERLRRHFANFDAPSGLTVVPVQAMGRLIDSRSIVQVNREVIARNEPVLDPFSIDEVRQIALRRQERRQRIRLGPEEQLSLNQKVITTFRPMALPTRDVNRSFHVEQLPEGSKKDRMKVGEISRVVGSRGRDGLPRVESRVDPVGNDADGRDKQITALAERANQGDKSARRELRQLRRETEQSAANQPNQGVQQDQLRQQLKQQKRLERQKREAATGQQEAARQTQMQQVEDRRRGKQLRQRQQEPADQQRQAAEQLKQEQRKQMKQQSRMQRAQQEATGQTQQQVRQQQKQQKRLERKPPQASAEPIQRRQELSQQHEQLRLAQQAEAVRQKQQLKAQRHEQQRVVSEQQRGSATMRPAQQASNAQARELMKAQRHEQQRAMSEQQRGSAAMRAAQQTSNAQAHELMKAQRRIERVQASASTPAATQSAPAQPQRKTEKAKRKNDGN